MLAKTGGDLTSISETFEEGTEGHANFENKVRRRSSYYSASELPVVEATDDRPSYATWRKALFGFGNFSRYTVIGIQAYFLNVFLIDVAGITPVWAGNILLVKQLYDGITDPLVGRLSDTIITRWGRRKPWIFLASVPSGFFWVLGWYSPGFITDSMPLAIAYFLTVLLLFSTMNTLISVPYNAMVPDVAVNYNDRTAVVLFQEVFGLSAVILFSYFQSEAVEFFKDDNGEPNYTKGYFVASLITVIAVVLPMIISILPVSERTDFVLPKEDFGTGNVFKKFIIWMGYFIKGLVRALLFKEFTLIVLVFVLSMIAVYLFVNNFVFYVKYVLQIEEQTSYLMLAVQSTATLSIFVWAALSKKIGKKLTYLVGCTFWIGGSIIIFFIDDNNVYLFYLVVIIRAMGSGVGYLIPLAMLPDIIELDFLKNRQRREGVLYSLMILLQKTGVGVAITGSNYVLDLAGYLTPVNHVASDYQPNSVLWSFRFLMCVIPSICLLLSLFLIYFIKVDQETMDQGEPIFKPK